MGNGASRSNSSQIPHNIRPQLQQRFSDVKKRLQTRGRVNPYKRELLNGDGEESGSSGSSTYKFVPATKTATMSSYDNDDGLCCVTVQGSKQCYVAPAREMPSSATKTATTSSYDDGLSCVTVPGSKQCYVAPARERPSSATKTTTTSSGGNADGLCCVTVPGSKQCYVAPARERPSSSPHNEGGITCITAMPSPSDMKDYSENLIDKNNPITVYVAINEEDDESNFDERMLVIRPNNIDDFPSSPSFRVYCTEEDKNRKSFDERFRLENGLVKEEPPSEEEVENQAQEDQKVEPKKVKQVRMRSFRKVIPKGGQIKSLLQNVNSCSSGAQGRSCSLTKKWHTDNVKII